MGYRSQVVLLFDKSILPKFLDVLAKCEETKRLVFQFRSEWDREFVVNNYGDDDVDCYGHHCITWSSIKWYNHNDDQEFKNIERFVTNNLEKARFLRIGENDGDHEDYGDFAQYDVEIQTHAEIAFI